MSANATQYLAESSKIKEESAQLETELSIARSIKTYLADVTRKDQLIPKRDRSGRCQYAEPDYRL